MRPPLADALVRSGLRPVAWGAVLLPLLIAGFVATQAAPAISAAGLGFALDADWAPTAGRFNVLPMLAGTIVSSLGAVALAGPVAVACGLHLNLFAPPRVAAATRAAIGVCAGIPSVVFGLVVLVWIVPLLVARHPPGVGLGVTILTLAAMVLPTAAAAADAAIQQVDRDGLRSTLALGLGRWDAARAVILPLAWPGIRAGLLLALGRAMGEAMAVLMVSGNTVAWPTALAAPFRTLTGNVAVEMAYASGVHRSALFATGGLLLLLVAALLLFERRRA